MKKARYICFEGTEGVGKTTQTNLIAQRLMARGYNVLLTKEPGTPHSPLTMVLRTIMLDKQYDPELTKTAREFISQAIRSIHLEKVIYPALNEYDFIIQDRGMLSGLAYGTACGNSEKEILDLMSVVSYRHLQGQEPTDNPFNLYSDVVYLKGNVAKGLAVAQSSKQEFAAGDAIEAKGLGFMHTVAKNMDLYSTRFNGIKYINVDNKSIEDVAADIFNALGLKEEDNGYKES
jgi:dTMP kinase